MESRRSVVPSSVTTLGAVSPSGTVSRRGSALLPAIHSASRRSLCVLACCLGAFWRFAGATAASRSRRGSRTGTFTGAGFLGAGLCIASRCIPTKNSFPAVRQYLATPENCSRCDWMYNPLPTATRAFIRMHAPCSERSSIRAVSACTVPDWSSHNASTKIITAVRGSSLGPLILPSIGNLNEQFNHHPARTPNSEHYFFLICHLVPRPKVVRLRVFL